MGISLFAGFRAIAIEAGGCRWKSDLRHHFVSIGLWCNGSTARFDRVSLGSTPERPTILFPRVAQPGLEQCLDKAKAIGSNPILGTIFINIHMRNEIIQPLVGSDEKLLAEGLIDPQETPETPVQSPKEYDKGLGLDQVVEVDELITDEDLKENETI